MAPVGSFPADDPMTPAEVNDTPSSESARRPFIAALSVLALLQGLLLLIAGHGYPRIFSVVLFVAGLNVTIPLLSALAVLIVANFGVHLATLTLPLPYRLAHVAIVVLYGAVGLAGLAVVAFKVKPRPALTVALSLAFLFLGSEALVGIVAPLPTGRQMTWIGHTQPHPVVGEIYAPYSVLRTVYPDNPRGYFDVRPAVESRAPGQPSRAEYSVTYEFNALGCRGRDYPIPRPSGRRRLLVLGAGSTLGVGVHERDTFAARLERLLNAGADQSAGGGYDVVNCGATGYTAREERLFYEQIGSQYEPDVVLVVMDATDGQEARPGHVVQTSSLEQLLATWRLLQNVRGRWQTPAPDDSGTLDELGKLAEQSRVRRARLAIAIFPIGRVSVGADPLATAAARKFEGTDVPVLDLGLVLLKSHVPQELVVHEVDAHPNAVAHQIAAEEIEHFLKRHRLVD